MKKVLGIFLAVCICVTLAVPVFAEVTPSTTGDGYLMINGQKYQTEKELRNVTAEDSTVVTDGAVIEVYGSVNLPLHESSSVVGTKVPAGYFWVLNADNVTVVGKTADATLYSSTDPNSGVWGVQSLIIVEGNNAAFQDVAILPCYNTYYSGTNKTVEVMAEDFTMTGCTLAPLDGTTSDGGSLYFNQDKGTVKVEGCTFEKVWIAFDSVTSADSIEIVSNTFDTPADENTYFIGNVTWSDPPATTMADVVIKNNTFENVPEDYDRIVVNRMQGTFILEDNTADNGKDFSDMIRFQAGYGGLTQEDLAGEAEVVIIENGVTKSYTPKETGDINGDMDVEIFISEIQLNKTSLTLEEDETEKLEVTVIPADTTEDKTVTWTSSDDTIATVDQNGVVTAKKIGTATITATVGEHTATCTVTVKTGYTYDDSDSNNNNGASSDNENNKPENPSTGDNTFVVSAIALLAISGAVGTAALKMRKSK